MEPLKAKDICEVVKGVWVSGEPDKVFSGISTDSRKIVPGDLFIPIKGENFDGHDYLPNAMSRGAVGIFTRPGVNLDFLQFRKELAVIQVDDPKYAMGELARFYRTRFPVKVIGVTGSNGKTSTKEMIAAILEKTHNTIKNEGSFNNDIGLPLTLFRLNRQTRILVQEMGMNHPGEIRRLVEICPPDIGVVTNVADAHIEYFGTKEAIAEAKFELLEKMSSQNIAVLNADDVLVSQFKERTRANTVFFSLEKSVDFQARDIEFMTEPLGMKFTLNTPDGDITINLPVLGTHQVANAVAAAATAWQIVSDKYQIKRGLESFKPAKMRMQIIPAGQITLINDAYNANPKSLNSALDCLKQLYVKGRKVVVLGDMRELGEQSQAAHISAGVSIQKTGAELLIAVGSMSEFVIEGAMSSGMSKNSLFACETRDEALDYLKSALKDGDVVLLKASRKMEFERLASSLEQWAGAGDLFSNQNLNH